MKTISRKTQNSKISKKNREVKISELNFAKINSLLPVVVQDSETLEVLMIGFMNREALEKTISDGKVTFYSRSKKRLWQKGETSGSYLFVEEISQDCDQDSLLILAKPAGPTCHTGNTSCFNKFGIFELFKLIEKRKKFLPQNSYTKSLFKAGKEKILEKITEESAEVIQAAKSEGKKRLIEESCDLIYHLFVLLVNEKVGIEDVESEFTFRKK